MKKTIGIRQNWIAKTGSQAGNPVDSGITKDPNEPQNTRKKCISILTNTA